MVKNDDFMDSTAAATFDGNKEKMMEEDEDEDEPSHPNWLPPRSKSAGLKYAEYESDESGRIMPNSKIVQSIDGDLEDRRLRRQIANCNERRRMQSINAGFQQLRHLLPRKDGDKMSKASILAATAEFIQTLLRERNKLLEENAQTAAKRRRLDNGEQNGAPTMDEVPANVLECIKTIGELRDLLQKETQLRITYEKELVELRHKFDPRMAFPSPGGSDFSPNSSASSTNGNNRNLLIELARQPQQPPPADNGMPPLFRPTPLVPSEVNILSSAIASLAAPQPLLGSPIGINGQQQQFGISTVPSGFVPVNQPQVGQAVSATQPKVQAENGESQASISQRNLQALVLAIRHLEGASPNGGNLLVR